MAVLNLDEKYVEEKGDTNDAKKTTLELAVIKDLNRLFQQIGDDWATIYSVTGMNINLDDYSDQLQSILKDGYRSAIKWFKEDFKRSIEYSLENADNEEDRKHYELLLLLRLAIEPQLIIALNKYAQNQAPKQAEIILGTTKDIINKRINATVQQSFEDDEDYPTWETIAAATRIPINQENKNRSAGIAEHEIGVAAGDTQLEEGELFGDELRKATISNSFFLEKVWHNRGDGHVRQAHVIAGGQRRRLAEPFIVWGEMLKAPRDTSLGASMKNILGCRCWMLIT